MTNYPAPETLFPPDLGPILDKLQENLPNQLPSEPVRVRLGVNGPDASRYASLISFQPDDGLQVGRQMGQ
jgi:hypothetical protein